MLKLKKIAVTGTLSSGKSTVCSFLQKEGAYLVSADEVAHSLLVPSTLLGKKIIALLGEDIVENNLFSRKKIAEKVFKDLEILKKLEGLLHPIIVQEIDTRYEQAKQENKYPFFVVEIPLFYEASLPNTYDYVIVVAADSSLCKKRWLQRKKEEKDFFERSQRELPLEEKKKQANFVIENQGNLQDLYRQVKKLYQQLTQI